MNSVFRVNNNNGRRRRRPDEEHKTYTDVSGRSQRNLQMVETTPE